MIPAKGLDRRTFLGAAASTLAFTIVPRHVLGGQGTVAPSDKITFALDRLRHPRLDRTGADARLAGNSNGGGL